MREGGGILKTLNCVSQLEFTGILTRHFNLCDKKFLDRIFKHFDIDRDNLISREEWVVGMSIFLVIFASRQNLVNLFCQMGSAKEQVEYCFSIYDTK